MDLAEGQDDSELTPQVEAPYGIFIAITSFADELFLLSAALEMVPDPSGFSI